VISLSQRPLPDNTQHSQQTDIYAPGGIRTHDLSRRAAADLRLRPSIPSLYNCKTCSSLFNPEDEGSKSLQNVGTYVPNYQMPHSRQLWSSFLLLWEPYTSQMSLHPLDIQSSGLLFPKRCNIWFLEYQKVKVVQSLPIQIRRTSDISE